MAYHPPAPSQALIREVRAAFIKRGSTFAGWCRQNEVNHGNARLALLGAWNGPKGKALRARIVEAAGLLPEAA